MRMLDVPVPDRLKDRPRDHRGFIVPWVSCWHDDAGIGPVPGWEKFEIDGDTVTTLVGVCDHVDGSGTPELASLCPFRQVRGMIYRLCDACGGHIDGTLYWLGQVDNDYFRECPLHLECALYSLRVCPGLMKKSGVGVVESETYSIQPGYLFRNFTDENEQLIFPNFRTAQTTLVGVPSVLISAHATPHVTNRTLADAWVTAQLNGSPA